MEPVEEVLQKVEEAPGHERLRQWFAADGTRTYAGVARLLGLSAVTVASWCRPVLPSRVFHLSVMLALEFLTGIAPIWWLTESELERLNVMFKVDREHIFDRPKAPVEVDPRQLTLDTLIAENTGVSEVEGIWIADEFHPPQVEIERNTVDVDPPGFDPDAECSDA